MQKLNELIKIGKYWLFDLKEAQQAIEQYTKSDSKINRVQLINSMFQARAKHQFSFDEFFRYGFLELSPREREQFISNEEHFSYLSKLNNKETSDIFTDKGMAYETFKKYFKRDATVVRDGSITDETQEFLSKHKKFIVKPLRAAYGENIAIYDRDDICAMGGYNSFLNTLCSQYNGSFIAEELIKQSSLLGQFHEKSVNTLRISTLRLNDRIEIVRPFAKFGFGDAIVDNATSGGITCPIEKETGKILWAVDEIGNKYDIHPDSGIKFKDFVIPFWKEAITFAKELAMVLPENRWTGWDVALTDDGWVMVEGNAYGQFVAMQIMMKKGMRGELDEYISQL